MFTESNTVEQMILDTVAQRGGTPASMVREDAPLYGGESLGDDLRPARWTYAAHTDTPRQLSDVMVEPWVREALIRLNPDIAAQPDRADEVIYNLRACILSVQTVGLVRANENFMAWLRGEKTMPFGHNGEHVPVRLVDAVQPANTYEAPGCQGTKISCERFFDFFPPVGCQHRWPSAACSDLISHAGAPTWLHQTPIEVRSSCP